MGFSTLLDIMGSVIIGGVMMTIAYRLSDTMTEKTYNNNGELNNTTKSCHCSSNN
jgi:hypothetical protein